MPVSSTVLNENFNRSVDSGFIDITTGLPAAAVATPSRLSPHERVKSVVKILREGRMSILDFILRILDPSQPDFMYNRDWLSQEMFQEQDPMEVDIDLEETYPLSQGTFQKQDPMEVDIESNDANTVGASQSFLFGIHQVQGTHLMDGDASVNADIDMNEFYLENMESREAMQIDADSDQIDID
ncbi:hypothetical protein C8R48DRAFT_778912 [Suillus tomentosus]|nr:hypothetical protein C8R48DRAFT_778912 [Suillus tomentosus]